MESLPLRGSFFVLVNVALNTMGPFIDGWTEVDVDAVLARGKPEELLYVPIALGLNAPDFDREWVERICLSLSAHPDPNVRGNAVLGFGHIARTCRDLNQSEILPVIEKALNDSSEYVRGHAESAACDVHQYLGIVVNGYDTSYTDELHKAIDRIRSEHGI
jgi:hypothetical protein